MICVGIDVAKDKHDCCIISSEGEVLAGVFTIQNTMDGFEMLYEKLKSVTANLSEVKVGLEATGHYSYNILGYLLSKDLTTYLLNPLQTNLFRKSLSLRKTKTDRVDARAIAAILMSDIDIKPYTTALYNNEELKSLTRYRFDQVQDRARLKQSVARLINILFPEIEKLIFSLHAESVYSLLLEFPGAKQIASAKIDRITEILQTASRGRYTKDKAVEIQKAAKRSIGTVMNAKSMELKHTIRLINEMTAHIEEIEAQIKKIMDHMSPPTLTIKGIGYDMGAMIVSEVGDFERFDSPDKILAFGGLSPSTYQSGQLHGAYAHMEKRGSRYLRYAVITAAKHVCRWDKTFAAYLAKKRSEGKHYNVAISHAAKKLVRLIFALQRSGESYRATA
jgi:transposase